MTIHELLSQFSKLDGAVIGQGPKHPQSPDATISAAVTAYFTDFPVLKRDQGYVDFMEAYAGASLLREDPFIALDIFGFTSASSDLIKIDDHCYWQGESNIVDKDGFLAFATLDYTRVSSNEGIATVFAFDITDHREWGIYKAEDITAPYDEVAVFRKYCDTFAGWLEAVLVGKGIP